VIPIKIDNSAVVHRDNGGGGGGIEIKPKK
jgi:hypothetical protein